MASKLVVGSKFPSGVTFSYVPYTPRDQNDVLSAGEPIDLDVSEEASKEKVLILGVPGAFTPTCTQKHIEGLGSKLSALQKKGIDEVIVTSANDAFVLYAWGKALRLADKVKFAGDTNLQFAKSYDLTLDGTAKGMGLRTARFAIVVNKGTIEYVGVESNPGEVTVSGIDAVLSKL